MWFRPVETCGTLEETAGNFFGQGFGRDGRSLGYRRSGLEKRAVLVLLPYRSRSFNVQHWRSGSPRTPSRYCFQYRVIYSVSQPVPTRQGGYLRGNGGKDRKKYAAVGQWRRSLAGNVDSRFLRMINVIARWWSLTREKVMWLSCSRRSLDLVTTNNGHSGRGLCPRYGFFFIRVFSIV